MGQQESLTNCARLTGLLLLLKMAVGHPPEPGLPSSPCSFPACICSPSPSLALPDARKKERCHFALQKLILPLPESQKWRAGKQGFSFWELTWVSWHFPWPWAVTFHSNHFTKQSLVLKKKKKRENADLWGNLGNNCWYISYWLPGSRLRARSRQNREQNDNINRSQSRVALESTEALTDSCQDNGGTAANSGSFSPLRGHPGEWPWLLPSLFLSFSFSVSLFQNLHCSFLFVGKGGRENHRVTKNSHSVTLLPGRMSIQRRDVWQVLRANEFPKLGPKCLPEWSMCFQEEKAPLRGCLIRGRDLGRLGW